MALRWFRTLLRTRHMAWVLAWALCLPFAQWASATHALLHLHASVDSQRDAGAPAPAFCDTCIVAAAIGGGGAPAAEPPVHVADLPAATPVLLPAPALPDAAPTLPYRSRAPPLLPA